MCGCKKMHVKCAKIKYIHCYILFRETQIHTINQYWHIFFV